ncbi:hypothetical protein [Persephonella sp.]
MSAVIDKKNKNTNRKNISVNSLKKFLGKLLEDYNIKGECLIPSTPDIDGDYFIVVYAKNIKSSDKAIKLSLEIQKILANKFGDNIVISIIPK